MAKKSKTVKSGGLPDVMDMMASVDSQAEILSESQSAVIDEWINTGNYLLNACISGSILKGIPSGKISCFYGASGSGKSFLSCATCRQAIKAGYNVLYLDSESSITKEFMERLGCDTSKIIIRPVQTITETTQIITNLLNKLKEEDEEYGEHHKFLIILDSLGNLSDDSELENAEKGETKANLQKNKLIKNLFRVITVPLSETQTPMIVVSHSYESMSMFSPGNIVSGGCLTPETRLFTTNGVKAIKDVTTADDVLSHDNKFHRVLKTFNFEKLTYTVETDSTIINCSDTHRFLTDLSSNFNEESWTLVTELQPGDTIYRLSSVDTIVPIEVDGVIYEALNITSIKQKSSSEPVVDLTVEDTHNYVTTDGIINHNSGIKYNASVMLELFPSKLVDKENDDAAAKSKGNDSNVKTGITVTAKCAKNRFARPKKISVVIPFWKALNPYLGLEQYMSWDVCKVTRGNMLTEKEYEKLGGEINKSLHSWELNGKTLYCQDKDTARGIVVGALGKQVSFKDFFTKEVFTDELLAELDEKIIRPEFELPNQTSFEDIEEIEDTLTVGSEVEPDVESAEVE